MVTLPPETEASKFLAHWGMAPAKGKKGKTGKKTAPSTRPPFDYTPLKPEDYERVLNLTVKLVSWSYLNFVVRVPVTTSLAAIKQLIRNQHKGTISSNEISGGDVPSRIGDLVTPFSGITDYDRASITAAANQDIKLYKGSPVSFPPLPDNDLLTLQDVGYTGAAPGELEVDADIFYDYTAPTIIGRGKERF